MPYGAKAPHLTRIVDAAFLVKQTFLPSERNKMCP